MTITIYATIQMKTSTRVQMKTIVMMIIKNVKTIVSIIVIAFTILNSICYTVLTAKVVDDRWAFLFRYIGQGTLYHCLAEGPLFRYPSNELDIEKVRKLAVKNFM